MLLSKHVVDAQCGLANGYSDSGHHDNLGEGWWLKVKTGQQQRENDNQSPHSLNNE